MKRILDIDKLQEAQQRQKKQKSNYWQRIKNDHVKFDHYKEWRKQYVDKKREKETRALSPSPIVIAAGQHRLIDQTQNLISAGTPLVARGLVGFAMGFAIRKI